jgi:dihydroorotate dehydrogenase (NAD+) catalytic subunit
LKLEAEIAGVRLATPLIGASGLFGYGNEYIDLLDYGSIGAIITKTITLEPREGNPPPRIVDVGSGVINSIGLENVGFRVFVDEKLPALDLPCKVFVSIGGAKAEEYGELARGLDGREGIDAIEVNISCPNVEEGGIAFGSDAEMTRAVVSSVREATGLPVLVKIPPIIWGIETICEAAIKAGADALTVANTYPAMAIDLERQAPVLGAVSGGLSGGAIRPITLLMVWRITQEFGFPVVGVGGIETSDDAIEFMLAGARAIQVGSAVLKDHKAPERMLSGMRAYLEARGYETLEDLRSKAAGQGGARGED